MILRMVQDTFQPANFAADETKPAFTLEDGEFVVGMVVRVLVAFNGTTPLLNLGNPDDTDGYATSASIAPAATGIKNVAGAFSLGRYVALDADTRLVNWFYDQTSGTTTGRARVTALVGRLEV